MADGSPETLGHSHVFLGPGHAGAERRTWAVIWLCGAMMVAEIAGGAVEVASLGEAFGLGVQRFSESSEKLLTVLQRIEGALGKSLTRSDEQLAYYVAQAREIIDLSIMSQKQIVDDMQQLSGKASVAGGV